MTMTRYFFISTDLGVLEQFEQDLERAGIVTPQIHVLTEDEGEARRRHVHQVTPFMKKDVVHSALLGAAGGACLAALALFVTLVAGWYEVVGGAPFIFLAIVLLGFCTWVGGFRGIQTSNSRTRQFDQAVRDGKHVFFVDHPKGQGQILEETSNRYPSLEMAGLARGAPDWLVFSQYRIKRFFTETFP